MSRSKLMRFIIATISAAVFFAPKAAVACSACFGKSDSKLAEGMNWGIMSLLVVVGFVLSGFLAFGIYLVKRSAAMTQNSVSASLSETTQNV